jgi:hypothetical protein
LCFNYGILLQGVLIWWEDYQAEVSLGFWAYVCLCSINFEGLSCWNIFPLNKHTYAWPFEQGDGDNDSGEYNRFNESILGKYVQWL